MEARRSIEDVTLDPTVETVAEEIQERELTRFEQAEEFQAILLGTDLYPGGLARFDTDTVAQQGSVSSLENDVRTAVAETEEEERKRTNTAEASLRKMMSVLDGYQEQSYLLDPYLEAIVKPPVLALQWCGREAYKHPERIATSLGISSDAERLARLLYYYTKVRGYKTIIHFFPHAVNDLLPTLTLLEHCMASDSLTSWEIRYILLLWLSLICMIPFDLAQFDAGARTSPSDALSTMSRIEAVGRSFLSSPGKERDAAANVLCKLFQRRDANEAQFSGFLRWSRMAILPPAQPSTFLATGILQTLCNIVKVLAPEALSRHLEDVRSIVSLYSSDEEEAAQAAGGPDRLLARQLANNSVVNKYKAKMACRLGLKALKPRKRVRVLKAALLSDPSKEAVLASTHVTDVENDADEDDVPDEVEGCIAKLIDALQDKDTVVRYSAAKGISRICCRLPTDFIDQVADEITSLFAVNVADFLGKGEDLSNVSEFTWQGCCLALAELARRGLLQGESVGEKLAWVEKALLFDVRRGAHSVGSGVRDASCYVLWALARAHDADAIRPYAKSLSEKLVCVSLLDRDISIRRAASAAFQECVGRLNLFAHGIDVIRKTDFYAVGVRRNAFLQCLPQVAEHEEYRTAIIEHLMSITIVHWDVSMRELGAQALALVVKMDVETLGPAIVARLTVKSSDRDTFTQHGSLLALAEIGSVCRVQSTATALECRSKGFDALRRVPRPGLRIPGTNHVLRAACRLISTCATEQALHSSSVPQWDIFVDMAMERQEEECHDAAAEAISSVSRLMDLTSRIEGTIKSWRRFNLAQSQSSAKVLGSYNYQTTGSSLDRVLRFLIQLVDERSPIRSANVETRRNACKSIANVVVNLKQDWEKLVSPALMTDIWQTLLAGLEDYSTDARGDVGSWVRLACMDSLRSLVDLYARWPAPNSAVLPRETFTGICAGLAKQMAERIDSVRTKARQDFLYIVRLSPTEQDPSTGLTIPGRTRIAATFPVADDGKLVDLPFLYGKIVRLLDVPELRSELLKGIIIGLGSQRETINRSLAVSLTTYITESGSVYERNDLVYDLANLAADNIRSNRLFIPCLQAFNVLLEEGVIDDTLTDSGPVIKALRKVLDLATRTVDKVKSVPRILAVAQYATNILCLAELQRTALDRMPHLLLHPFPTIRASSAELLYVQAQNQLSSFPDEAEELLLSTTWAQSSIEALQPTVEELMTMLKSDE